MPTATVTYVSDDFRARICWRERRIEGHQLYDSIARTVFHYFIAVTGRTRCTNVAVYTQQQQHGNNDYLYLLVFLISKIW